MKKKILFVLQQLDCGGVEKAFINLLNLIDRKEWECELLVISNEGNFRDYLPKWLKTREYICPYYVKNMIHYKAPEELGDIKRKEKIYIWRFIFLLNRVSLKILKKNIMYKIIFEKYKKMNDFSNYDMMVDFHGYGSYTTYLVAEQRNVKAKVSWIHEQNIYMTYSWIRNSYKKINHIFGCSLDCCQNFVSAFPEYKKKVSVYYNYLDVNDIIRKAKVSITEEYFEREGFKIVSVGRVSGQKAFYRAIDAAKILKNANYKFVWVIVGDGDKIEEYRQTVKKEGIDSELIFHGYDENPYRYIAKADLYVQTSVAEGFCTTISEAIVLGKPVVTTSVGGVNEQLDGGKGGIVVEHNPDKIANAIIAFMEDEKRFEECVMHNKRKNMKYEREIEKLYNCL